MATKSTFAPLRLSAGAVTASDINRIQDLIDAGFKDLASKIPTASAAPKPSGAGIVTLTSSDGSIGLTPGSGTGSSVDLSAFPAADQIVVTATSTVPSLTVPGLDGNNDGDYQINGMLIDAGVGSADWWCCSVNNVSGGYGGDQGVSRGLVVGNNSGNATVVFNGFVSSKANGNGVLMWARGNRIDNGNAVTNNTVVFYQASPFNVTSLVFLDDSGTAQLAAGSYVRVRKLRNKY